MDRDRRVFLANGRLNLDTLIISQDDVRRLLSMEQCIEAVRTALTDLSNGAGVQPLRPVMWMPEKVGALGMMPGHLGSIQTRMLRRHGARAFAVVTGIGRLAAQPWGRLGADDDGRNHLGPFGGRAEAGVDAGAVGPSMWVVRPVFEAAVRGGLGFGLVIILFAAIRERLADAPISKSFSGYPIAFVAASLVSLAFLGFTGLFGISF